jgi:hypothetical protein
MKRLLPTIALALLLPALTAGPAVAKLKPVAKLRATKVGTNAITITWRDRSKGEAGYEVTTSPDGSNSDELTRANAERAKLKGLEPGTVYRFSVRACATKASKCAKPKTGKPAATLLAPFNGPHPGIGCDVFPGSDDFNQRVTTLPTAPRSNQIISGMAGDDLHPDFGSNPKYGIPYVVVPPDQPRLPIRFTAYGNESDKGPYPIPPGAPIEGGRSSDGDRHILVVQRPASSGGDCSLFELYRSFERGAGYSGDSGSVFDLGAALIGQRPDGWTSADAAGLPIFPGLVTYEEVQSGEIDHAIRMTFDQTRRGYYPPATHYASDSCSADLPAMGERLRLKPGYDISGMTGDAKVIATALKQYGGIVADNGSNFYISGSTDRRWNDDNLNQLKEIPGTAFEVVKPTRALQSPC